MGLGGDAWVAKAARGRRTPYYLVARTSRMVRSRAMRLKGLVRMRTDEPAWAASAAACSL